MTDVHALTAELTSAGVAGVTIHWADNNGIPRSRTVPVAALPRVAEVGVGVTTLFAVFDAPTRSASRTSRLATPSGDVRLIPVLDKLGAPRRAAGAGVGAGRQVAADGAPWPYDQRSVLERQVEAPRRRRADRAGGLRDGVRRPPRRRRSPAHRGPAYSPHALVPIDGFVGDCCATVPPTAWRSASCTPSTAPAQVEARPRGDGPGGAADDQLLARQTLRVAAARTACA